jgi:rRNA maturation endonuclease Nob1
MSPAKQLDPRDWPPRICTACGLTFDGFVHHRCPECGHTEFSLVPTPISRRREPQTLLGFAQRLDGMVL